ncbi:sulfurtransferase [Sulfurimonas sp.]|uniref:sulfurtransferase n=1 Tax=Sulfurimonas sp. TaxID=2022749 RepID=UPI0035640844
MKYFLILSLSFLTLLASDAFIQPSELKHLLEDKKLIIIDVADSAIYKTSHIQGAIYCDVTKFIKKENNPYSLMDSPQIIGQELRNLGINQDSKVVIYAHNTQKGILNTSYLAFVLLYSGFENLSILDGGYMSWVFENERLTSSKKSEAHEEGNLVIKVNQNILATLKSVQNNLATTPMLDARSPKMYYGTERSNKIRTIGHISYAKSSHYEDKFLRDTTLREQKELDEIYIYGHGLKKSDEVIVYGDDVFTASMEFYILYKHMGFKNTKLYEASLLEWGNSLGLPMTRFKWE